MFELFMALAEPNRLQIVELLVNEPCTVLDIADRLSLRQTQTSKHLRVLREAGLVSVEVAGQHRRYSLEPKRLKELDNWLVKYRRLWDDRFEQFDRVIADINHQENQNDSKSKQRKREK